MLHWFLHIKKCRRFSLVNSFICIRSIYEVIKSWLFFKTLGFHIKFTLVVWSVVKFCLSGFFTISIGHHLHLQSFFQFLLLFSLLGFCSLILHRRLNLINLLGSLCLWLYLILVRNLLILLSSYFRSRLCLAWLWYMFCSSSSSNLLPTLIKLGWRASTCNRTIWLSSSYLSLLWIHKLWSCKWVWSSSLLEIGLEIFYKIRLFF